MKKFKYVGPHDSVDVAGVGTVTQGDVIDAEPDLAERLEDQPDNWQHIPIARPTHTPAPAKKAAAASKKTTAKKTAAKES